MPNFKIILRNVAFSRSSTWESMINFYSTKNWLENSPAGVNLCLEEFEFVWFFYKQASKARTRACLISKNDLEAQLSPISRKQLKPSGNSFSLLCSTSFLGLWHPVHVSLTMVFLRILSIYTLVSAKAARATQLSINKRKKAHCL